MRRHELHHDLVPGQIGLIPEIGSAAALARLSQLLGAVDRLVGVGVDLEAVANDLGAPDATSAAVQEPLLAQIAVTATAARVPWTVAAMAFTAGQARGARLARTGARRGGGIRVERGRGGGDEHALRPPRVALDAYSGSRPNLVSSQRMSRTMRPWPCVSVRRARSM